MRSIHIWLSLNRTLLVCLQDLFLFSLFLHRVKNEHNKRQVDQKLNKPLAPSHLLNKDTENKDPSESGQKAPLQTGISKLPVLAKSLRLQMPSHFKQSHHRWEEKPLAGKAKKKKPCTRPIPFNLSQPKNTKNESKSQLSVAASTKTHANKPEGRMLNVKHTKHRAALSSTWDSTEDVQKYHGKAAKKETHLPGQSGLVRPGHFSPDTAALQSILLTDGVTAGAPVGATPRNSVCPPGRGTSIYTAQRVPVGKTPVEITGAALKKTPQTKWTPQRVPNPSYQPMSAMVCIIALLKSCTLFLRATASVLLWFCFQKWHPSAQRSLHKTPGFENVQTVNVETEDLDARNCEKQLPIQASSVRNQICHSFFLICHLFKYPLSFLVTDLIAQKPCSRSSAVALLRKRFPPLEELRLDEEVAFFISLPLPSNNGCPPPRPRCENPLAITCLVYDCYQCLNLSFPTYNNGFHS
uniref:Uncharacterized protein n=1 Tax=Oryzias sinensis TaxID=183150 RepID=A0A8C7ZHR8_9TELE